MSTVKRNLKLIKRRKQLGMDQTTLAERAGLSRRTVYQAECGLSVSDTTKCLIAHELQTTVEAIF